MVWMMAEKKERHNYEYDIDLDGDSAPARVVRMVGQNKRVLEVGAGPGSITRILKEVGHCRVTGLEIDKKAIEKLVHFCEKVYETDLNDSTWAQPLFAEEPFDVIVAADVLEHVYDPLAVLTTMAHLAGTTGQVVLSLPHVSHHAIVACLLDEDFQYRDWGLLDRTHIRFFGLKNMQQLFENAGLKIIAAQFVITAPEQSEHAEKWLSLDTEIKTALTRYPHGQIYQVVVQAVSQEQPGSPVDLISLPVDMVDSSSVNSQVASFPRRMARKYLSRETRERILWYMKKW